MHYLDIITTAYAVCVNDFGQINLTSYHILWDFLIGAKANQKTVK